MQEAIETKRAQRQQKEAELATEKRNYLKSKKEEKLGLNNLAELKYPKKLLLVYSRFRKKSKWRGGRVVEGARLESVYRVNSIMGSNPILSAKINNLHNNNLFFHHYLEH